MLTKESLFCEITSDVIDVDGDVIMSNVMDMQAGQHEFIPPINSHEQLSEVDHVVSTTDCVEIEDSLIKNKIVNLI